MKKPNFFIIGAPKCGTTSLAQWLGEHPDIYMSVPKEPHFFSTDLKDIKKTTKKSYLKIFEDAKNEETVIGEASVWYLYSEVAVSNILEFDPEARFIVCLRNPIEMAVSLHNQHLISLDEHLEKFEDAWMAQTSRREGKNISKFCIDPKLILYREACSLGSQVERLFNQVRKDKVCLVFIDDMKIDPRAEYIKILSFLGAKDDGRQEFPVLNMSSENRSQLIAKASKSLRFIKRLLSIPDLGTGISKTIQDINRRPNKRKSVDASFLEQEVKPAFLPEIDKLARITKRDLSHWKT